MHKNQKNGFVLIETLIVSTLILTTLVFLYLEFKTVRNKYNYSFNYDTVAGIYMTKEITNYLDNVGYSNLINLLNDETYYVDISSATVINGDSKTYTSLINNMNIDKIIFTSDKLASLKNYLKSNSYDKSMFSENFKNYILNLSTNNTSNHRVIIKFNNDTFANAIIGSYPTELKFITKVEQQPGQTHKGIVYLDPTDLSKECNAVLTKQNVNKKNAYSGVKTGCMKWYIFDDDGDTYKMILDHNTTETIKWNNDNINVAYEQSNLKPVVDDLVTTSKWVVTPRLITGTEVAKITNNNKWNNSGKKYCLGSNSQDYSDEPYCNSHNNKKYAWLFNHTSNCLNYGCTIEDNNKYPHASDTDLYTVIKSYWINDVFDVTEADTMVWDIGKYGMVDHNSANGTNRGIRPVIELNKSLFE